MDAATGGRMDAAHSSIRRGSKTPPSSPPSHTGPASTQSRVKDAPSAREEGRTSHGNLNSLAESGEAVPPPRAAADDAETAPAADGNAFADELLKAAQRVLKDLPAPLTPGARTVRDLAPIVAAALADGWTPETLTARLTVDLPTTVRSARALLTHRLDDLPPPPLAEEPRPALPPHCGDARCRGGWLEDETGLPVGRCESWPHQTGPVLIHTARAPLG